MAELTKNFATSLVATAPSPASSGTSLVVTAGEGTLFPDPAVGAFNAIICPASAQPTAANAEIVRVTARSTDTLTITRTQESSSARTVVVGDRIFAGVTVKTLTDLEAAIALQVAGRQALSTYTTKGDIVAATASAATSRLGVGSNEQALVADSAQTVGMKWASPLAAVSGLQLVATSQFAISASQAQANIGGLVNGGVTTTGSTGVVQGVVAITAADWAITGRTAQLRVRMMLATNATAPTINFTAGLSQITATAGGANATALTIAAQAGTTVTRTAPAASTIFTDTTADFALPTDGLYVLTVTTSGAMPATNPKVNVWLQLFVHHT